MKQWNRSASWVSALVQQHRLPSSAGEFALQGQQRFPNPLSLRALKCWSLDTLVDVMRNGRSSKATWTWPTPTKAQQTDTKSVAALSACRGTRSAFALRQKPPTGQRYPFSSHTFAVVASPKIHTAPPTFCSLILALLFFFLLYFPFPAPSSHHRLFISEKLGKTAGKTNLWNIQNEYNLRNHLWWECSPVLSICACPACTSELK